MSTSSPVYVLDTNVFVQAHRRHYAFEICPGFWDCLIHHHQAGRIVSIDRVRDEILVGDGLEAWVKASAPATLFAPTADLTVTQSYADMVQWVQANSVFKAEAKAEFAQVADGKEIIPPLTLAICAIPTAGQRLNQEENHHHRPRHLPQWTTYRTKRLFHIQWHRNSGNE